MKKISLLIVFTAILTILQSCNFTLSPDIENSDAVTSYKREANCGKIDNIANQMIDSVGIEHNICLNLIFTKIDSLKSLGIKPTKVQLKQLAQGWVRDFIELKKNLTQEEKQLLRSIISGVFNEPIEDNTYPARCASTLNTNFKIYLDKINILMNKSDMNEILSGLLALEEEAKENLCDNELFDVLSAISIAKYTSQYWNNNMQNWTNLANSSLINGKFSWSACGKSDVKGGVIAATGGGASWLLGGDPVGWKAWGALVVGGAVAGSAQYAIDVFWP
jgi:hypothetical protein